MMYGYGFGFMNIIMMLVPMVIFGLIVYWAVYSGVKNALKDKTPIQ